MPESAFDSAPVEISSDDEATVAINADGPTRRKWKSLDTSRSVKARVASSQPGTQQLMHACCCKTFLTRRHWLKTFSRR